MNCTKCGMPITDGGDNGCRCNFSSGSSVCSGVFAERDKNLRLLGFGSYDQYLASDLWDWIKSQLQKTANGYCWCCRASMGLQWHHRNYDLPTLAGNFSDGMFSVIQLCQKCHMTIHCEDGVWFSMDRVEERMSVLEMRFEGVPSELGRKGVEDVLNDPKRFDDFSEFIDP